MIDLVVETRRSRPLPRPVNPFRNETIGSFVGRLAAANRLDFNSLRAYVAGDKRKSTPIPVDRISILSSHQPMPCAIRSPNSTPPRACPSLVARASTSWSKPRVSVAPPAAGARGLVMCHLRQEDVVCRRHHRWIGNSGLTAAYRQPTVVNQPDIIAANRLHRRMTHRYGQAIVEAAYHEAKLVGGQWRKGREHTDTFFRVMGIFHPGHRQIPVTDPTVEAAAYPRSSPSPGFSHSPLADLPFGSYASIEGFVAETQRTAAPEFRWNSTRSYGHCGPLAELFVEEAAHRMGQRPFGHRSLLFT